MQHFKSRWENSREGFTLVELLIVVIIIGILASIGVPQYAVTIEKARSGEAESGLAMLQSSEKIYYAENEKYLVVAESVSNPYVISALDISLPQKAWKFKVDTSAVGGVADQAYTLTATRKSGKNTNETITMTNDGTRGGTWTP